MAGAPNLGPKLVPVHWEDGSTSNVAPEHKAALQAHQKSMRAQYGIGTAVLSRKTVSPVIDKRSAKQKMMDAQARKN